MGTEFQANKYLPNEKMLLQKIHIGLESLQLDTIHKAMKLIDM